MKEISPMIDWDKKKKYRVERWTRNVFIQRMLGSFWIIVSFPGPQRSYASKFTALNNENSENG